MVLSARLEAGGLGWRGGRLWLRLPADLAPPRPHGDAFAAGVLMPAMAAGLDVIVEGPVSPSLAANVTRMQELLVASNSRNPWTRVRRVSVEGTPDEAPAGPAAAGLFFSGGVDSMYSLVAAHRETGRHPGILLFVKGFDVPLEATARGELVLSQVAAVARLAGTRLVVMETNLRHFTDRALHWDMAHGAGLAFAGHAIGAHVDLLLVSASDSHFRGDLGGTTTVLDPLWSRSGLTFASVGGRLDRQMKAEVLADEPWAQRHLVVCWKAPPGSINCGRCAKCLRTMLQFLVLDALSRFDTLPHEISPDLLSADVLIAEPLRIQHWEEMVLRLSARPAWQPLAEGIRGLIARSHQIKRAPRLTDVRTRDRRMVAAEWIQRTVQRNMPPAVRWRLLPLYRRWRQNTGG